MRGNATMPRAKNLNVLFVGNSFTARNDVPGLVESLATAGELKFHHRLISAGGASLRRHWNGAEARRAIERGGYDYVVLQEQSTLPLKNPQRMHENVRLFDQSIRAAGSKTALYMTWARRHEPQNQRKIARAYTAIADELGATLLPVGLAWGAYLRRDGAPVLYDRDNSHPSIAGSYLAACVMYLVLYGRKMVPAGVNIPGMTEQDMKEIDAAVTTVC
jgi:hypothetical protein